MSYNSYFEESGFANHSYTRLYQCGPQCAGHIPPPSRAPAEGSYWQYDHEGEYWYQYMPRFDPKNCRTDAPVRSPSRTKPLGSKERPIALSRQDSGIHLEPPSEALSQQRIMHHAERQAKQMAKQKRAEEKALRKQEAKRWKAEESRRKAEEVMRTREMVRGQFMAEQQIAGSYRQPDVYVAPRHQRFHQRGEIYQQREPYQQDYDNSNGQEGIDTIALAAGLVGATATAAGYAVLGAAELAYKAYQAVTAPPENASGYPGQEYRREPEHGHHHYRPESQNRYYREPEYAHRHYRPEFQGQNSYGPDYEEVMRLRAMPRKKGFFRRLFK